MQNTKPDEQIAFLLSKLSEGVAYCKILIDQKNKPVDWIYLDVNEAYEKIANIKKEEVIGKKATEVFTKKNQNLTSLINRYGAVALTGKSSAVDHYSKSCGKWQHISAHSLQNGYFVVIFEDITVYKEAEELRHTKADLEKKMQNSTEEVIKERRRLYSVLETLPSYITLLNKDHKISFANQTFRELFGESHEKCCYDFLFNRNTPCENCEAYKVLETNKPVRWELVGPNGNYYDITSVPFIDQDGSTNILEVGIDITDRKRDEADKKRRDQSAQIIAEQTKTLHENEEHWSTTLNSICDAVIATNVEGNVTFMNPAAEKLVGLREKEATGKLIEQIFHIINEQTRQEIKNIVSKVLMQGVITSLSHPTLLIRKDNKEIPIGGCGTPIITEDGTIRGVVLVFRDITEQRKPEEANKRQAALLDLSPVANIVHKTDGTITFWSKGAEKSYGWTKAEAIGKCAHELLATKFPQPLNTIISELNGKQSWTGTITQKTKDGNNIVMQSWWLVEKIEQGEIKSILESSVDITERERIEKESTRLASYLTLNPNPILEVDFNGKINYANPATEKLFPDLKTAGLSHPFFLDWQNIKETFEDKKTNMLEREVKINGHWYNQQFCLVPQTHQIRIYITDINESKKANQARARAQQKLEENTIMLEEYASQMEELAEQRAQQLQSAERLAAIGQTAGMVGHDIRNPLQAITSDMYLISEEIKGMRDNKSKQAIVESIDSINQNLTYINKIVSDLQDYTRPLKPNVQNINLSDLILSTLLTISVPKRIEVVIDIKQIPIPVKTDIAYIRRILTNLVTNAVQAMQEKGKLTVKADVENDIAVISVHDTGMGLTDEVRCKMFTPLFTTKSKGQGLGLAVVKRLVDALNGTIKFESEKGKGTLFTVELPQTRQATEF
ncbi:MAG: PAS domain S-box protein [Nitrososphaerota archaeon]|jgi:PAS domain S-box-containing protein|uniref:PAS domain S-box protein n=1 Tax=Candidatus Bathycorpusculum sp. TaxID=2994959 RepID=UPI0028352B90|nr:PAS domain S-box protein [Candidatus Termitimicrobium sp.]MCL2431980.1 PAS domain S-box protein [Candidatus Termitimicrobium sp.]MDR0492028.1 PAS domain S-box protein [Nitrososphaerota archaeon]